MFVLQENIHFIKNFLEVVEMKKFLSAAIMFCVMIFSANCQAKTLLANISPAEFSARYQYYVGNITNVFGSMAATDYSKFLMKDFWHDPKTKEFYASFINEDYDNGKYNAIHLYAGNNPKDKEIYHVQICIENNFENLRDSLFIESSIALACLNITDANSDRIYRLIDGLDNEYKFFDSTARKNIYIEKSVTKNANGYEKNSILISAY